jgi:hypothetical protein
VRGCVLINPFTENFLGVSGIGKLKNNMTLPYGLQKSSDCSKKPRSLDWCVWLTLVTSGYLPCGGNGTPAEVVATYSFPTDCQ